MKFFAPPSGDFSERRKIILVLALSTAACAGLIVSRCLVYQSCHYLFLVWNLFLAWIPVWLSMGVREAAGGRLQRIGNVLLFPAWLVFLPNGPYVLTDLFHLRPLSGIPLWLDWLILLSCGWTGLLLAFWSLIRMENWLRPLVPPAAGFFFVPLVLVACAYGVYLGRFERWNSWDIIAHPFALAADVLRSLFRPRALGMTLLFSVFLGFAWWCFSPLLQKDSHDQRG